MKVIRIFSLWLFLSLGCVSSPALAAPWVSATSYWVDDTGTASFETAQQADFIEYERTLQLGYSTSVAWIKVQVSGLNEGVPFVLTSGPSFIQSVRLFDQSQPNGGDQQSGRSTTLESASFQGLSNGFLVPGGPVTRTLYLRLKTTTSLIADINVFETHAAEKSNSLRIEGLVFYLGCLFLTAMWGLINWFIQRDALYGYFSARQLYAMVHVTCYSGLLRYWGSELLSATLREHIYNVVVVTIVAFYGFFETHLLRDFGVSLRWRIISRYVISLSVISLALISGGWVMQALRFNILVVMLFTITLVATAMTARASSDAVLTNSSIWVIRWGYILFLVTVFLPMLSFDAIIPAHWLIVDILILPSAVSSILMLILLSIRTRQRDMEIHEARINEALSQNRLALEQDRRQEKEGFLSMLTHELRNPLSVIRMRTDVDTQDGRMVQKAAVDMAKVLDRVQQSERHEFVDYEPTEVEFDLRQLLSDIMDRFSESDRIHVSSLPSAHVKTDRQLLEGVLSNLIDNAVKYGRQDAAIDLDVRVDVVDDREGVRFTVTNVEGEAGSPDSAKVFSKYYRAPRAHRAVGSGLGLYLIAQWVRFLQGTVGYSSVRSAEGEPLVAFSVWIPQ